MRMRTPSRSLVARPLASLALVLRGSAINPVSCRKWWYQAKRGGSKGAAQSNPTCHREEPHALWHNPGMSFAEYSTLRRAVFVVALLNLAYFGVEFAVALAIGSVSLFADSVDFLEDASINLLIAVALSWSAKNRARLGMVLACIILVPVAAALYTAVQKFLAPVTPAPVPLTLTGAGAFMVNLTCALMLTRFRHEKGSLTRAAFL